MTITKALSAKTLSAKTLSAKTLVTTSALALAALASPTLVSSAVAAPTSEASAVAMTATASAPSEFVRFNKKLSGSVSVHEHNGQTIIRLSDDFRASRGPDLKIFLSPQGLDTVSGDTATQGSVQIGELQRLRGTQDYLVPAGVSLSRFASVLVHCEQFSVLWGGAALS